MKFNCQLLSSKSSLILVAHKSCNKLVSSNNIYSTIQIGGPFFSDKNTPLLALEVFELVKFPVAFLPKISWGALGCGHRHHNHYRFHHHHHHHKHYPSSSSSLPTHILPQEDQIILILIIVIIVIIIVVWNDPHCALCRLIHYHSQSMFSAIFEVIPNTEEPFSHHWWTLYPPKMLRSLFNVPPTPSDEKKAPPCMERLQKENCRKLQ